jgi:tRNA U34 5-methylaminomethyl-2-thiouridine-forming methyltransferase MnmC
VLPVKAVRHFHPVRSRDGSLTLYSRKYRQTFGSVAGARTEATWVYLQGSGLDQRLAQSLPASVLEVGLGTGLNFLVTAEAACRHRVSLNYVALEADLEPLVFFHSLQRMEIHYQPLRRWWDGVIQSLAATSPQRNWHFSFSPFIQLRILLGDAATRRLPEESFQAIYQDAFSPQMNAELWSHAFLGRLIERLAPEGRLVSYCVQGEVRRRLAAQGLQVQRRPGPPRGKREVLCATKAV